jgi:DNA-binding CsgD family transcriptional regulator
MKGEPALAAVPVEAHDRSVRKLAPRPNGYRRPIFRVAPYVLLAVSALLATIAGDVIEHRSAAYRLGTIAVAGLAAGWMLWMVTLHPSWARRRRLMALYCAGLLLLLAVLVTRSPWFGLFALTGYLHTWELLPGRWRVAGVTASAAIQVTAIFGDLAVGRDPAAGPGRGRAATVEPLTQRELEVLQLIARGTTNREAARRLFISEASVKAHLLHVYAKLGVNDRAAAVATAYERGC